MSTLSLDTAPVFEPLLGPSRYKGAYGGRGSGKSHFFAEALVEDAIRFPGLRAVCIREHQQSLKESAKKLIEDKIQVMGVGGFEVLQNEIRTPGAGSIIFQGMKDHTAESIKSLEGMDRAWIEEAHTLSAKSWQILRPTIRKESSEIWASWNPTRKSDPIDEFFRKTAKGHPDVRSVECRWRDNPWFPAVLEDERRRDKATLSSDDYDHVWEGAYAAALKGAYYGDLMAAAEREGRIGFVPHDPLLPVHTAWDLGTDSRRDAMTVLFFQVVGQEIRIIDEYGVGGEGFPHMAVVLDRKGYRYGRHYAPHDIQVKEVGTGKTRLEQAAALGIHFERVPDIGFDDGISAARLIFPRVWFSKNCERLTDALREYCKAWDEAGGFFLSKPAKSWANDRADAFRMMAVSVDECRDVGAIRDINNFQPEWPTQRGNEVIRDVNSFGESQWWGN